MAGQTKTAKRKRQPGVRRQTSSDWQTDRRVTGTDTNSHKKKERKKEKCKKKEERQKLEWSENKTEKKRKFERRRAANTVIG